MIVDFILLCLKFIGILFVINFCLGTIFTLIEAFLLQKKVLLNQSKFYTTVILVLYLLSVVLHILIYTRLTIMLASLNHTEVLSRIQLLLALIPLFLGISLMTAIANHSERNFEPNFSKGQIKTFIPAFINFGLLTLIVLEVVLFIAPSVMKNLIVFYNYFLE